jgi:UDP-glucose 4-epimerase
MSKSIVISGATGCIGYSLVKYFLCNGHRVLLILRPDSSRNWIFEASAELSIRYCELGNYESLNIGEKYDIFYHFAWSGGKNRNDIEQNLDSARNSAEAVKLAQKLQCKVFVGAGSQAECGSQKVAISENTICKPINEFGLGKLFSYYWTQLMCAKVGIRHCWLRILSIYGPYDGDQTLVNSTILKILNGEQLKFTDGEQYWDFLFSDDAAEIIGMIGLSSNSSGIYAIGSGKVEKLKDFISIITNYFNIDSTPFLGLTPKVINSVDYLKADTSRLEKEFNWNSKISFESGIDKTVDHLKSRNG